MPYSVELSEELRARLEQLGSFLCSTREVYFAMWDEDLVTPRPGSQAMAEFGATLLCPSGDPWPADSLRHFRDIAVKLTRETADGLVALGLLYKNAEVISAPIALVRSAFEHAARAFWLLDPRVAHRQRCARADLTELISLDEMRKIIKVLYGNPNDDIQYVNQRRAQVIEKVKQQYMQVDLRNDRFKWSIEYEKYTRFTDIAELWAEAQGTGVSGLGVYDALSLGSHPQGFLGTHGIFHVAPESTDTIRIVELERLETLVNVAVLPFYSMLCLLTSYHGLDSVALREFEAEIDRVLPGVLRG